MLVQLKLILLKPSPKFIIKLSKFSYKYSFTFSKAFSPSISWTENLPCMGGLRLKRLDLRVFKSILNQTINPKAEK